MDYDELKKNLKIFENDEIKLSELTEEKWDDVSNEKTSMQRMIVG